MKKSESVICEYQNEWVQKFLTISNYLQKHLVNYIAIEHVGSTSIPGMYAKPIIDIDVEISSYKVFPLIEKELEKIGYCHEGDQGIKGREAFKRSGNFICLLDEISHHLYVCPSDSEEYKRHIIFRDTLRENKHLREEYNMIKHDILRKVGEHNRTGYVKMKDEEYKFFFERVINKESKN